jgi:hypothetical protein
MTHQAARHQIYRRQNIGKLDWMLVSWITTASHLPVAFAVATYFPIHTIGRIDPSAYPQFVGLP